MSVLPEKLKTLSPYQPNEGTYEVRLDANESFLQLPDYLLDRLADITKQIEYNRYPDPSAAEVTKAFANYFNLEPERCVASNGSDELISLIINCLAERGDKVLCLSPDFSMYRFYSGLAELETCDIMKNENMIVSADEIIKAVKKLSPSVLIFSNPCNPTGQALPKEDIKRIARECGCLFVLDEAYMDFYGDSLLPDINEFENLIILKTCSKAFGLAAIRLGFAVTSKKIAGLLMAVKSPYNVNTVTQQFGCAVLSEKEYLDASLKKIMENKLLLEQSLEALSEKYPSVMSVIKTKTNFAIVKTAFASEIFEKLKTDGIAVRCFPEFLRITAGSNYENGRLLQSLEKILSNL